MNIFKNKVYSTVIFVLVVAVIALVIFFASNFQRAEIPEENGMPSQEETPEGTLSEYPHNLLEGDIISIDASSGTIVMRARLSKIDSDLADAERTINAGDAEVVIYNIDTETETPCDMSELKEGDGILVSTAESTFGVVATRLEYTAVKISKMVKNENL